MNTQGQPEATINEVLRDQRRKAHLSYTGLAKLSGVDWRTIRSAEEGARIQEIKAQLIAEALSKALETTLTIESLNIETV